MRRCLKKSPDHDAHGVPEAQSAMPVHTPDGVRSDVDHEGRSDHRAGREGRWPAGEVRFVSLMGFSLRESFRFAEEGDTSSEDCITVAGKVTCLRLARTVCSILGMIWRKGSSKGDVLSMLSTARV